MKIKSKLQLSKKLNVHRHTVDAWVTKEIIPATGPWDLAECQKAVDAYKSTQAQNQKEKSGSEDLKDTLTMKQIQRIRGRTRTTNAKTSRLSTRLNSLVIESPRRETVIQLLEMAGLEIVKNAEHVLGCFTEDSREEVHPKIKPIISAENEIRKSYPKMIVGIIDELNELTEELSA